MSVYLTCKPAAFTCDQCGALVKQAVVTHVQTVFTAPALALHRGVGHTVVLAGAQWVVRCGDSKVLRPTALVVVGDTVEASPARKPEAQKVLARAHGK